MSRYHKVIGIDLGTTYSTIAVWDNDNNGTVIIPNGMGQPATPSVVGLDPMGKVIVGEVAKRGIPRDPLNTIIEIKRYMGELFSEEDLIKNPVPDKKPGEPYVVKFQKRFYLPQQISAYILIEMKRIAERFIGEDIHDAVITVPAYFTERQKKATQEAAILAGLHPKYIIAEPTAAAISFGIDKIDSEESQVYMVYDLGGGTFDVSIIDVSNGTISVAATSGNSRLGGGNFDDLVVGWVMQQIQAQFGQDLSGDPSIWARIKAAAEVAKRELSTANATMIDLPFLTPKISANFTFTRPTFEQLIDSLLTNHTGKDGIRDDTLAKVDEAIKLANESQSIEKDEIVNVLLVGGSTRIPKLRSMLAGHLGFDESRIRSDINPDEVVARGAAIIATQYLPSESGPRQGQLDPVEITVDERPEVANTVAISPIAEHSLGVMVDMGKFCKIIERGLTLPTEKEKDGFVNKHPTANGDIIPIQVYQGEKEDAVENTHIGTVDVGPLTAAASFTHRFKIYFNQGLDSMIDVKVTHVQTGNPYEARFTAPATAGSKEQLVMENIKLIEDMASVDDSAMAKSSMPPVAPPPPPPPSVSQPVPPPPLPVPAPHKAYQTVPVPPKLLKQFKSSLINTQKGEEALDRASELNDSQDLKSFNKSVLKIQIFVSYSHEDSIWIEEGQFCLIPWLQKALKKKKVEFWCDPSLKKLPGVKYREEIRNEINRAQFALLLLSQDFLISDFICEYELPWIKEEVENNEMSIIPILVGPIDWEEEEELKWLSDRQILPGKPTPLIKYTNDMAKWKNVKVDILGAIRNRIRDFHKKT